MLLREGACADGARTGDRRRPSAAWSCSPEGGSLSFHPPRTRLTRETKAPRPLRCCRCETMPHVACSFGSQRRRKGEGDGVRKGRIGTSSGGGTCSSSLARIPTGAGSRCTAPTRPPLRTPPRAPRPWADVLASRNPAQTPAPRYRRVRLSANHLAELGTSFVARNPSPVWTHTWDERRIYTV